MSAAGSAPWAATLAPPPASGCSSAVEPCVWDARVGGSNPPTPTNPSRPSPLTAQPDLALLRELLTSARTIAVVGFSQNTERPSHWIAVYLQRQGYRVIPVNPGLDAALGEKCYPT